VNFIEEKLLGLFVKTNGVLSKPLLGGLGHIFMLHRVLPEEQRSQYTFNYDLAITPEYLEYCINFFTERDYEFIDLDEMLLRLKGKGKSNKKFVVLTFDDGYRDNMTYGLPVLKKHNVPAVVYVTNCFPNHTAIFWWFLLEDLLRNKSEFTYRTQTIEKQLTWGAADKSNKHFIELRTLIKNTPAAEFREMIKQSFGLTEEQLTDTCKALSLTWDEVKLLSNESLITIGAHTMNHLPLSKMNEEEALQEMVQSKAELELKLGKPVEHFAYPYGTFDEAFLREYRQAEKAGFKTSVINRAANVFAENAQFPQSLPRFPLGNNVTEQKLNYIINGITHFSYNGFAKAIHY
jgi:peptidoglycan/xylan/chitin deacetylase (PgdA/CDA1 family)